MKGRSPLRACGPFLLGVVIAGCGEDSRPSAAEDERLNNAAEMLESAPDALEGVDDDALVISAENSGAPPP